MVSGTRRYALHLLILPPKTREPTPPCRLNLSRRNASPWSPRPRKISPLPLNSNVGASTSCATGGTLLILTVSIVFAISHLDMRNALIHWGWRRRFESRLIYIPGLSNCDQSVQWVPTYLWVGGASYFVYLSILVCACKIKAVNVGTWTQTSYLLLSVTHCFR